MKMTVARGIAVYLLSRACALCQGLLALRRIRLLPFSTLRSEPASVRSVVLPDPEGPVSRTISTARTSAEMS